MTRRPLLSMLGGVLACGLFTLVCMATALDTFQRLPAARQHPAPTFTLPDYQGTPLRLEELRGKVVVVRFWATW